jgi:hypothetical protein
MQLDVHHKIGGAPKSICMTLPLSLWPMNYTLNFWRPWRLQATGLQIPGGSAAVPPKILLLHRGGVWNFKAGTGSAVDEAQVDGHRIMGSTDLQVPLQPQRQGGQRNAKKAELAEWWEELGNRWRRFSPVAGGYGPFKSQTIDKLSRRYLSGKSLGALKSFSRIGIWWHMMHMNAYVSSYSADRHGMWISREVWTGSFGGDAVPAPIAHAGVSPNLGNLEFMDAGLGIWREADGRVPSNQTVKYTVFHGLLCLMRFFFELGCAKSLVWVWSLYHSFRNQWTFQEWTET